MSLRWIPNAICVVRLLLIWPIVLALLDGRFNAALVLMVIAGTSDALDGFLAKHFGWRTWIGGLLDPVADKLLVLSVFLTLTWLGLVPQAVTAIVVARDLVIVAGAGAYALLIHRLHGEPSIISKANTFFQLLFLVLSIFNAEIELLDPLPLVLIGAAVIFTSIVSGLHYVLTWSRKAFGSRASA
jgi:cardiolipin synthase